MYKLARSWEIQPNEFWDMTLPEFLCEMDMRQDMARGPGLSAEDAEDLREWMAKPVKESPLVKLGFSSIEEYRRAKNGAPPPIS